MEETDTKACSNCKRDIPSGNFTIHSVHCARNIRLCPVCKEPVPVAELQHHQNLLHKLVPCKQCGEGVCGSDLEDHIRDSCALTPGVCRYCELELPRKELPPHETYCGARTQRCECGELVMLKYKQLHEQSDHGFIKLEDEPGPEPSWKKYEKAKPVTTEFTNFAQPSSSNSRNVNCRNVNGILQNPPSLNAVPTALVGPTNLGRRNVNQPGNLPITSPSRSPTNRPYNIGDAELLNDIASSPEPIAMFPSIDPHNRAKIKNVNHKNQATSSHRVPQSPNSVDRFNIGGVERPNGTSSSQDAKAVSHSISPPSRTKIKNVNQTSQQTSSRNFTSPDSTDPSDVGGADNFNILGFSPSNRVRTHTNHQMSPQSPSVDSFNITSSEYSSPVRPDIGSAGLQSSNGRPPSKRTNDRPQLNLNVQEASKVNKDLAGARSQGCIKKRPAPPPPPPSAQPSQSPSPLSRLSEEQRSELAQIAQTIWMANLLGAGRGDSETDFTAEASPANEGAGGTQVNINGRTFQPMSPNEFVSRFNRLQLSSGSRDGATGDIASGGESRGREGGTGGTRGAAAMRGDDRFSDIKRNLRELRRGLNEVTAPYNSGNNVNRPIASPLLTPEDASPPLHMAGGASWESPAHTFSTTLPCEFCGGLMPPEELVQHETGCRPDLAQFLIPHEHSVVNPRAFQVRAPPRPTRAPPASPYDEPIIPCEFCMHPFPLCVLMQHQQTCVHAD